MLEEPVAIDGVARRNRARVEPSEVVLASGESPLRQVDLAVADLEIAAIGVEMAAAILAAENPEGVEAAGVALGDDESLLRPRR
jgi:hypothetical protein